MGIDRLAMDLGRPVFLWGASVGPFEAEPHFVPAIRHHLMRMSGIMVRERVSYDYLTQKLGLTNVTMMADPAFTLSPEPVDTAPFWQIGRAHVCTPVTNAHLVCRLLLEKKKKQ